MNKYKFLLLFVFVLVSVFLVSKIDFNKNDKSSNISSESVLSADDPIKNDENRIRFDDTEYSYSLVLVEEADRITLIPNYSERLGSEEIFEKYSCDSLVSAGFYSKENKPIGLFIQNGDYLSNYQKNRLFNGIYSINGFSIPRITETVPSDPLRIGLQAGPIIINNTFEARLTSENDNKARRVLAATTGENFTVFLVIYNNSSFFSGPYLKDLYEILKLIEKETNLSFADVLNLDGGTASIFLTQEVKLKELSPVGSFFCIN